MSFATGWLVWAAITATGFAVLQILALRSPGGPGNTLSAHIRALLGIEPRRRWAALGAAGLVAALVWFGLHIITGWV